MITTAWGRAAIDEFLGQQEQLLSDPDFSPEFDQLLDGSGVTELAVSTSDVKTFTTTNIFSPTSRRAFVAPNPAYFGMGRMAETYNSLRQRPSQIRVFYDLHCNRGNEAAFH